MCKIQGYTRSQSQSFEICAPNPLRDISKICNSQRKQINLLFHSILNSVFQFNIEFSILFNIEFSIQFNIEFSIQLNISPCLLQSIKYLKKNSL